jgi:hypothetical protein
MKPAASLVSAVASVLVLAACADERAATPTAATDTTANAETTAGADPTRSIACQQNGDGVDTFGLDVYDLKHARVTTDVFHTPSGDLLTIPPGAQSVRYTVTSETDDGFVLSPTDPYIISMIAVPTKVEFLDYRGNVLGTLDHPPLGEFRMDSIHGHGASDLGLETDSVLYSITVTNDGMGTAFKDIQGEHRLLIGEIETCTVRGTGLN